GATALMTAAGAIRTIDGDPLATMRVLLAAHPKIDASDHDGLTALCYACGVGTGFSVPNDDELAPENRVPSPFGHFRPGVGGTFMMTGSPRASSRPQGDLTRLEALIAAGADVNHVCNRGETPLSVAAGRADLPRVQALLAAGASARTGLSKCMPAVAAARDGSGPMFEAILAALADSGPIDPKTDGHDMLCAAVESDEDAAAKTALLLKTVPGVDVNAANECGVAPLAASMGWSKMGDAAGILLNA